MSVKFKPRALVVGDDGQERHRILSWFPGGWNALDGGPPGAAIEHAAGEAFGAIVYTAGTDSVDLETLHMALRMAGFGGLVIDTRPRGALPEGVVRATSPSGLAALVTT